MGEQDLLNTIHLLQNENNRLKQQLNQNSSNHFEEKYKKALRQIQGIIIANRQLKDQLVTLKNSKESELQSYLQVQKEELTKAYEQILSQKRELASAKEHTQLENEKLKFSLASMEETVAKLQDEKLALAQMRQANEKAEKYIACVENDEEKKADLKNQLHMYKEKQTELRKTLQNYEEHHTTMNRINRQLEENVNDLEGKLFRVQNQLKKQINQKQIQLKEVKSTIRQQYQQQISELKKQIHQFRTYNNQLSIKLKTSDLEKHIKYEGENGYETQLVKTLRELKSEMQPMSLQIADLQDKNHLEKEESIREKTNLQMKVSQLESTLDRYKDNTRLLQHKLIKQNEKHRQFEESQKIIAKLEEENKKLGGRLIVLESKEVTFRNRSGDDLEHRVKEFQSRIQMLLNDRSTIQNCKNVSIHQLIALKAYIIELDGKVKQLGVENEYSVKKYKTYKQKSLELIKQLKDQQNLINGLKGKMQGYDKLILKLQGQLERAIMINENEIKMMNVKASQTSNISVQIYKRKYDSLLQKLSLQQKYAQQELQTVKLHYETKLVQVNIKLQELNSIKDTLSLYKSKNEELSIKLSQKQNELLDTKILKPPQENKLSFQTSFVGKQVLVKLNDTLSLKQTQLFTLQNKLKTQEIDWKKKNSKLQQQLVLQKNEFEQLQSARQHEVELLEKQKNEAKSKLMEFENKIYALESQKQKKGKKIRKIQQLESIKEEVEIELKELQFKYNNEQSKSDKLSKMNETYVKNIKELEEESNRMKHELNKAENENRAQIEVKNGEIKKLKVKVQQLQQKIQLNNTLNKSQSDSLKLQKLKIQFDILENQCKGMEKQKNKYQAKVSQIQSELLVLKRKYGQLQIICEKARQNATVQAENMLQNQSKLQKLQQKNVILNEKVKEQNEEIERQKNKEENLRKQFGSEKKKILYELQSKEEEYLKAYRECSKLKYELTNKVDSQSTMIYENQQKENRYIIEVNRLKDQIIKLQNKSAFEEKQYIRNRQELTKKVTELNENLNNQDEKFVRVNSELAFYKNKQAELTNYIGEKQNQIQCLQIEIINYKDQLFEESNSVSKLNSQISYMRSRDEQMQLSMEEKAKYIEKLCQEINSLRNGLADFQTDVSQKDSLVSRYCSEIAFLKSEKQHLEEILSNKDSYISRITLDLTAQRNIQIEYESDLASKENLISKLTSEMTFSKNQLSSCEQDLQIKNSQIIKLKSKMSQLQENYTKITDQFYGIHSSFNKINTDLRHSNEYSGQLEQQLNNRNAKIFQLQNEIMRYRNEFSEIDSTVAEKDSFISKLNFQIAALRRKCQQYEQLLTQKQGSWVNLNKELVLIRSNIDMVEEELSNREVIIERYKKDFKAQTVKIQELNEEIFQKNNQLSQLNQEFFKLKVQGENHRNEQIYELQNELYKLKSHINKLQSQIQQKQSENKNLQYEFKQIQLAADSNRISDQQYEQLVKDYNNLHKINSEFKNQLLDNEMEISGLQVKVQLLGKRQEEIKRQNEQNQLQLQQELERGQKREKQLKMELAKLIEKIESDQQNFSMRQGLQLYEQEIHRLTIITQQLEQEIYALRLKLTHMNNQQDRIQENLTVMVLTFAEVEALRQKIKEKQVEISRIRKSLVNIASSSNQDITSIKNIRLGDNKMMVDSQIDEVNSRKMEYRSQDIERKNFRQTALSQDYEREFFRKENGSGLIEIDNQFKEIQMEFHHSVKEHQTQRQPIFQNNEQGEEQLPKIKSEEQILQERKFQQNIILPGPQIINSSYHESQPYLIQSMPQRDEGFVQQRRSNIIETNQNQAQQYRVNFTVSSQGSYSQSLNQSRNSGFGETSQVRRSQNVIFYGK